MGTQVALLSSSVLSAIRADTRLPNHWAQQDWSPLPNGWLEKDLNPGRADSQPPALPTLPEVMQGVPSWSQDT